MIEITHKQARRMIREQQDRQLPDEQWAMLQAHLESCPECCAYQARLAHYQREMIHSLRERWGGVRGPRAGIDRRVLAIIANRKSRRRVAIRAVPYVLAVLLLIGYIAYRNLSEPVPPPPPTPTLMFGFVSPQTATPRPSQLTFHGLAVFESHRDGNAEIYLLKVSPKGPELTNLTQNPANDTAPAWSPDGEWLAFLSDRTGKNEVYVMHVAGSRLTQLTDDPQIDWQGPLAWSSEGSYIGLRGRRNIQSTGLTAGARSASGANPASSVSDSWLYLVPLNGTQPLSLAGSLGAQTPVRFSTAQKGFAFAGSRPHNSLLVGNYQTGWTGEVTLEDQQTFDVSPVLAGAFDWSLGGRNLIYVVNSPLSSTYQSQIRFSQDLEVGDHQNFTGGSSGTIDQIEVPLRFKAVSWMPHSLIVASLAGSDENNCFVVRLKNAYNEGEHAQDFPGLCVDGGLSAGNWTSDGNWLVVLGHKFADTKIGLYGLHLPDPDARDGGGTYELLTDLSKEPSSDGSGATVPTWAEPQVRPSGLILEITPKAAEAMPSLGVNFGQTRTMDNAATWLVYSVTDRQYSQIIRMHPDGTERMQLTGSLREHTCPRISPDGKSIAYLSAEEGMRPRMNEVYRMGMDGSNVKMLTRGFVIPRVRGEPSAEYDCPVWSPDGKWLAAILRLDRENYLAIIPADGASNARYMKVETVSSVSAPIWLPDTPDKPEGKQASNILIVYPQGVRPARLVAIDLKKARILEPSYPDSNGVDQAVINPDLDVFAWILELVGWHDVEGLTLSPDGAYLAGVVEYLGNGRDTNNTGISIAQLRVFDAHTLGQIGVEPLPGFDAQNAGRSSLFWMQDGWLGIARVVSRIGPQKTSFERYNITKNVFEPAAAGFEDILTQPALIQGKQVIFTTESGLWAIDLSLPGTVPWQISGEPAFDLDWR